MNETATAYWRRWWERQFAALTRRPTRRRRPAKRRCSVKGCDRAVVARGNCHMHYTAARRAAKRVTRAKAVKVVARTIAPGVTELLPKAHALGRGVCSPCGEVKPLFRFAAGIMCRECQRGETG